MKSVFLSLQKTLVVRGDNTFDHAVFTSHCILVIFCVEFGETNCCCRCVELLKICWFGYFIKKPSKVCVLLKNQHIRRGASNFGLYIHYMQHICRRRTLHYCKFGHSTGVKGSSVQLTWKGQQHSLLCRRQQTV